MLKKQAQKIMVRLRQPLNQFSVAYTQSFSGQFSWSQIVSQQLRHPSCCNFNTWANVPSVTMNIVPKIWQNIIQCVATQQFWVTPTTSGSTLNFGMPQHPSEVMQLSKQQNVKLKSIALFAQILLNFMSKNVVTHF